MKRHEDVVRVEKSIKRFKREHPGRFGEMKRVRNWAKAAERQFRHRFLIAVRQHNGGNFDEV